ncbi:uncharacterized protein A1O5_04459 [Cladophialophora psammophila CBS 110553]|uniref:Ecp2 effector protein domain-containing protein n=1 Tax=Cladophialophora psammophila CBS 110553 TaxID=1182543 RepID=W9WUU4_9EURO|nr:uncharacterized protein A1O5_04459 [Cladophialophora psammophila CBS 110553]EXJ71957.1 hypothetical protein A1O5_04459 [Cladophialophora psammophila CBS 110553]
MVFYLILLFCALLLSPVAPFAVSDPSAPEVVRRADVSFDCPIIDHWFKHNRHWIRAFSTTGCMSLETIPDKIYALNALLKPDYISNDFPSLICSLNQNRCGWTYSPLDYLGEIVNCASPTSPNSDVNSRQVTPACENLDEIAPLDQPLSRATGYLGSAMAS